MREIKFRGLEVSTGSWVVGSHVKTGADLHYIVPQNVIGSYMPEYHVKKETVGQFTGLHDKNGKEIYESDIFHMGDPNITYTVVWHDTGFKGKQNGSSSFVGLEHWQKRIEIISNIYQQEQTS